MGPGARVVLRSNNPTPGSQVGREGRGQAGRETLGDGWIWSPEAGSRSKNSNGVSERVVGDDRV